MQKITEEFKKVEKSVGGTFNKAVEKPRKTLERFPTLFLLLVTAGIVLTLYGFEQTFAKIELFEKYPILMIVIGVGILIFTGRLYKQLDK